MHGCVASTTTTSRPLMAISAAGHQRVPTGPNRPGRPASVAFANAPFTSFSFSVSPASPSLSRTRRVSRSPSPLPFTPPSSLSAPVPFHLHASYLSTLFREDYSRWCNNVFTRRTCRVIPTVLPDRTRPLPRVIWWLFAWHGDSFSKHAARWWFMKGSLGFYCYLRDDACKSMGARNAA